MAGAVKGRLVQRGGRGQSQGAQDDEDGAGPYRRQLLTQSDVRPLVAAMSPPVAPKSGFCAERFRLVLDTRFVKCVRVTDIIHVLIMYISISCSRRNVSLESFKNINYSYITNIK